MFIHAGTLTGGTSIRRMSLLTVAQHTSHDALFVHRGSVLCFFLATRIGLAACGGTLS